MPLPVIKVFVFIFGSMIGSFLNVCIFRLPLGKSVVKPRSYCPSCGKTIPWHDNIPLLSYLFLMGKCRFCRMRIPTRYFLIELITAAAFLLFFNIYGFGFELLYYAVFISGLIIATFVDIQHRIIPDEISVGGIIVGFLLNLSRFILPSSNHQALSQVVNSFLGIIIGGGIIYLTAKIFDLVYFKMLKKPPIDGETESMGGGDVKLLAMIGAFLGWQGAVLTFFIAPFFGLVVGVANLLIKKEHTIPYGPFLSLAAVIVLFWSGPIVRIFFIH
ncbi:MAG: prepilin peptidase [Candidatus Omnitrophota bacterium]|nr:prepilin peptidase [Candidatus Omnitrophota bacterium]MBU1928840.1 prepilin peptidase [Candidatus Omnitrophota bacterium]MBU2034450.1 prepilin peptidase [Candidatus Omnitrophota bacterium]MBU2221914.1 prepilin peptidase [Candidatus Omnitrophota bacterium]MBU2257572.1 prepilin peptidase [Candidatus Omnitrophota bacterium]